MTGHLGELLSAFLDGEVTSDERSRIGDHVWTCGRCRAELDELTAARAAVRSLPVLETPASAVSLPPTNPVTGRRIRVLAGTAAAVAAMVVGFAALSSPSEPAPLSTSELPAAFVARSAAASSFNPTKAFLPAVRVVGAQGP